MPQRHRDALKRVAIVLLAALLGFGTGFLLSVAHGFVRDRGSRGELLTVPATVLLVSLLFIVAAAAVAFIRLLGTLRGTGQGRHPDDRN